MSAVTATAEKAIDIQRRQVFGDDVSVLADIYNEDVNLAVWRPSRNESTASAADWIVQNKPHLQLSEVVSVQSAFDVVCARLNGGTKVEPLCHDIAQMVDMFCCLFDLRQVGLRLSTLDKAMCSRFHADRVPARLVTTFCGAATQWLSDDHVDRSKLGVLSKGLADADSGLYANPDHVQALQSGDVALLKGELWRGNAGSGLVHRSPAMPDGSRRLLMTLDFFDD